MIEAIIGSFCTILGVGITLAYQWFAFRLQRKDQFRLAALDKRLEKHQEAFTLWHELFSLVHNKEERTDKVLECQDWWFKNCLYLDPKARSAFRDAFISAWEYDGKDEEMRKHAWPKISGAGDIIAAAVDLPAIGDMQDKLEKIAKTSSRTTTRSSSPSPKPSA